ncbi:MAG: RNA polymerase sigma factor, partial [Lentisphaeraceae bacterium]|nr:RNA polymerase sigma factor [Lentisphaeraceae bacterium]
SWKDFVEAYRPYIYRVVRRMNLNHEDSEDLSQSILIVLWDKIPTFEFNFRTGAFRAWLCKLVRNRVLNYLKTHNRRSAKLQDEAECIATSLNSMPLGDLEKIAKEEWEIYVGNKAWEMIQEEVDEKAREAFKLSMQNVSSEEISEKLGITVGSVYVYKQRVKDKLKEKVRNLKDEYL